MSTDSQFVFTVREAPHRIEICEGNPFDSADEVPSDVGNTYMFDPLEIGESDVQEVGGPEYELGDVVPVGI